MDRSKMLQLVVPDLTGFKLKPYVANATPREKFPLASTLFKTLAQGGRGAALSSS